MKKRYLEVILLLVVVAVFGRFAFWNQQDTASPSPSQTVAATPTTASPSPLEMPDITGPGDQPIYSSAAPKMLPGKPKLALTKIVKAKMVTDLGELMIDIYPEAAPNAAKRFQELIQAGYYDNTHIFRIVPGFVAQFGINSKPNHKVWKDKNFNDDPSLFRLEPGTLAFAKAGPNSNSTQVFINYNDNSPSLSPQNFTTFAKVTKGYGLTEKFKQVGDPSMGLSQQDLWADTDGLLKSLPEKPTMILKAEILE
jgi:cyclophilin family peptidyl-prolyl cis-trans isomerase